MFQCLMGPEIDLITSTLYFSVSKFFSIAFSMQLLVQEVAIYVSF